MRETSGKADVLDADATGAGEYTWKDGYVPLTYNLPADYSIFVEEFKRDPGAM